MPLARKTVTGTSCLRTCSRKVSWRACGCAAAIIGLLGRLTPVGQRSRSLPRDRRQSTILRVCPARRTEPRLGSGYLGLSGSAALPLRTGLLGQSFAPALGFPACGPIHPTRTDLARMTALLGRAELRARCNLWARVGRQAPLLDSRSLQRIRRDKHLHLGRFAVITASLESRCLIEARQHLSSVRFNPLLHLGPMRG